MKREDLTKQDVKILVEKSKKRIMIFNDEIKSDRTRDLKLLASEALKMKGFIAVLIEL
jgi:hypothetical protein